MLAARSASSDKFTLLQGYVGRVQCFHVLSSAIAMLNRAVACLEFEEKRYVNRSDDGHTHETQTVPPTGVGGGLSSRGQASDHELC